MNKEVIEYLSELTERECETVPEMAMDRITYAIQEIERLEQRLKRCGIQYDKYDAEIERLEGVRDAAIPIADNGYAEESDITRLREALNKDK